MNLRKIIPLLLMLCFAPLPAARAEVEDLSPLIAESLEIKPVPGAVAAIVRGDRIIALGAAGFRCRGTADKVTVNDQFHIGSCTKSMTATLCAMLVEEGKLRWDTTLGEVFSDLREKMQPAYRTVTLAQLLTNHGGIPANATVGNWNARIRDAGISALDGRKIVLEAVVTNPPEAEPGKAFIYSNASFIIAGHMAEKVTGESFEELLQKRLFQPLGMTSAGFGAPGKPDAFEQPYGHAQNGFPVEPGPAADNPQAMGPAGTVHCSVIDWAKFAALHLQGERGQAKLLKPETFKTLHTAIRGKRPGDSNYAMGWTVFTYPWAGGVTFTHAGSNNLWYANMLIAPNKNLAILIMTNQGMPHGREAEQEIERRLITTYAR
ncbi:MAG TPA: serine hydrolase domain-containing protein [Tepidisphaeraceae bacterium]|jgi:CubicO group peptidase (beta-lactamase class C family)